MEKEEYIKGADGTMMLQKYFDASQDDLVTLQKGYREGRVSLAVNNNKAISTVTSWRMKPEYKRIIRFWHLVALLFFLVGIISFFLVHWIVGLGLIYWGYMQRKSNKQTASQFIIDYSMEHLPFFRYALSNQIIKVDHEK